MNWNNWIRQIHRWLSIVFTVTVIANFIGLAQGKPVSWVTYSPLPPLALLLLTGLYFFAVPYAAKWRSARRRRRDRKSTRLNSSHWHVSRMPSSA